MKISYRKNVERKRSLRRMRSGRRTRKNRSRRVRRSRGRSRRSRVRRSRSRTRRLRRSGRSGRRTKHKGRGDRLPFKPTQPKAEDNRDYNDVDPAKFSFQVKPQASEKEEYRGEYQGTSQLSEAEREIIQENIQARRNRLLGVHPKGKKIKKKKKQTVSN